MKLFSKRNKKNENYRFYQPITQHGRDTRASLFRQKRYELVNSQTRTRLTSLLKFITSSDLYLEKYILIDNKKDKVHYFNQKLIDDFSESELGYKFSNYFSYYPFKFKGESVSNDEKQTMEEIFDDFFLFDLLETTILFSKETKRLEVIKRIDEILKEEQTTYCIKENLITKDGGEDLKNISNQLKDYKLVTKINSFYSFFDEDDYINAAKISAEILNIIFSDGAKAKKVIIDKFKKDLASSIVINTEEKEKRQKEFVEIIDSISKLCQTLNNDIFDVRHSEKNRIKVSNEYFYKLICNYNISLIEIGLTSLKDKYIASENWEAIKNKYLEAYKINKDTYYYIPEKKEDEIDPEDIPF